MKAFVTGGTGFIGKHVVRKLLGRGYRVDVLARSAASAEEVRHLGANPVRGELNTPDTYRQAMQSSNVVFHIAGWYELGSTDQETAHKINVEGTRSVLQTAVEVKVPRIVYVSTIFVLGDTHGVLADETYVRPPDQPFLSLYERTKWEAHTRVAEPLIAKGAPIIIVMPGGVYGPGDHSLIGDFMTRYYRGQFPVFPAPDLAVTYAHVEDIAEGIILASEKGRLGESYLLVGPAKTMHTMVRLWSRLAGVPEPLIEFQGSFLKPLAPLMDALAEKVPLPRVLTGDVVRLTDATYIARSDKARRELGWTQRPLEEGMLQTLSWVANECPPPPTPEKRRRQAAGFAIGAALGLLLVWVLGRLRKRHSLSHLDR